MKNILIIRFLPLIFVGGCILQPLNLVGKKCTANADCGDNLQCVVGICGGLDVNVNPDGGVDAPDAGGVDDIDGGVQDAGPILDAGPDAGPGFDAGNPVIVEDPLPRPLDATWRYHDLFDPVPADWASIGFDDSAWRDGIAPLGFGDADVTTEVSYGPDPENKLTTTYFRHEFDAEAVAPEPYVWITYRRDDGVVFYLNGVEIHRDNLPDGQINPDTFALVSTDNVTEDTFFTFSIPSTLLAAGQNVIAVEVHQITLNSSDLFFQAGLEFQPDAYVVVPPAPNCDVYTAPEYSLCGSFEDRCEIIFEQSQGCDTACALAGLVCTATWSNIVDQCAPDLAVELDCNNPSGNVSDFCTCSLP